MKKYLLCYRRKNDTCCHRQKEFDYFYEVLEFTLKIVSKGSKVLNLYRFNEDITDILVSSLSSLR